MSEMNEPAHEESLLVAFRKLYSWPEGDSRRNNPLTPNDPATIATLAGRCRDLRAEVARYKAMMEGAEEITPGGWCDECLLLVQDHVSHLNRCLVNAVVFSCLNNPYVVPDPGPDCPARKGERVLLVRVKED